ncbi:MAG: S1C family serine protease [Actinomycetota bacterium]|nr:S1C family serine protease [Actinomycetota bacterium]
MVDQKNALTELSNGMADAVERISPALVQVNGRRRYPSSGIVHAEDRVLTSSHALERDEDIKVETHDGRTLDARLVGRDAASDLAVLEVESLGLKVAERADGARVGQLTLAVGRPFGEGVRASFGIVSAVGSLPWSRGRRERGRRRTPERYVQADAAPYPGLGGGPLIDAQGHVIGVVSAGFGRGTTLAVPSEFAWKVAERLEERGSTKRGYLGILSQSVRLPDGRGIGLTQTGGLLVVGVEDDSPAARSGIILGDILATLDGQPVEDTDDLLVLLGEERAGKTVPVQVVRGGELRRLDVAVGERD